MKKIIPLFTVLMAAFLFAGCFPQTTIKLNIAFIVDGEVYAAAETDKNSIEMPADPKKENYEFDGWFWDKDVWEKPFTLNSLMDAPLSETMRVYAKFTTIPAVSASFYRLQEAHDLGIIKPGCYMEIGFYYDGSWPAAVSRAPMPKVPEFLSVETATKIKQSFLDDFNQSHNSSNNYTINDISITNYCGTYDNAVVVMIEGLYDYTQATWTETVTVRPGEFSYSFDYNYRNGNYLRVWVETDTSIISPF